MRIFGRTGGGRSPRGGAQMSIAGVGGLASLLVLALPVAGLAASPADGPRLSISLASASTLTDQEMATETASGLHTVAPAPAVGENQPKVHLWDELQPPPVAPIGQNQSVTITVHTVP
jgi:hypothetical protein